jgi:hypothetical protein
MQVEIKDVQVQVSFTMGGIITVAEYKKRTEQGMTLTKYLQLLGSADYSLDALVDLILIPHIIDRTSKGLQPKLTSADVVEWMLTNGDKVAELTEALAESMPNDPDTKKKTE